MPFKGADGCLRLRPGAWVEAVVRPEIVVRGEQPHSHVPVEHPFGPALRISKLWLEAPTIRAPVDQLGGIVLSGRCGHLETGAQQHFLVPFQELLHRHRWPTLKVNREPISRIQKTGTVKVLLGTQRSSLKAPQRVGQRRDDVGRPSKEAERMVIAENLYVVGSGGAADGKRAIVVNVSVVESPGQRDRIGMQWSNHVGARSQILSLTDARGDACAENDTGSPTERKGNDVGVSAQSVSLPWNCRNRRRDCPRG